MAPGEEQAEELALLVEKLAPAESLVEVDCEDPAEQLFIDELLVHRLLDNENIIDELLVDQIFVHKLLDADSLHQISYLDSSLQVFINKSDITNYFLFLLPDLIQRHFCSPNTLHPASISCATIMH